MAEQVEDLPVSAEDAAPHGGSFLFQPVSARPFVTPEKFSAEQRQFFRTGDEFMGSEVVPLIDRLEQKDNALLRRLLSGKDPFAERAQAQDLLRQIGG